MRSKADPAALPGERIATAKQFRNGEGSRYVLYPEYEKMYREFALAFETVWREGQWCVYIDELFLMHRMHLDWHIDRLITQGRTKGITVVGGMQRPVGVSRFPMSQATHLIAFSAENRDAKILRDIGGDKWALAVSRLERFQFAWYYVPERRVKVLRLQDLLDNS